MIKNITMLVVNFFLMCYLHKSILNKFLSHCDISTCTPYLQRRRKMEWIEIKLISKKM